MKDQEITKIDIHNLKIPLSRPYKVAYGYLFLSEDPVVGGMIEKNGVITLLDTPGHGANIPEEKLNTYESITITE